MRDVIIKFLTLQEMEQKTIASQAVLSQIPDRLAQALGEREKIQTELLENKAKLGAARAELKSLELDMEQLKELKSGNKLRQTRVSSEKEYNAIYKESEVIKARSTEKEEATLALMLTLDQLSASVPQLEAALAEATRLSAEANRAIESDRKRAQNEFDEATRQREESLASLDSSLAERFLSLAANRHGKILAPVSRGTCLACNMSIPPQLFNELQRVDKLMVCPNCHRLMFWRDDPGLGLATPESAPAPVAPKATKKGRAKKSSTSAAG
ncbi:MAG: C4-type zinc ribbon domain-containing protein [Deltaproteobacteria bacterium]|nr:C4-type zinc ribbon domain-containing protein [Deltaproteobacteria bacterium]